MLAIRLVLAWSTALLLPGCIVDRDSPCGPDQELNELGTCACVPGTELDSDRRRCEPAPDVPAGLGESCEDMGCGGTEFPHCQQSAVADYCTSEGCAASADCEGGYACNTSGETTFCERPPVGQGEPCASDADCADGEATFCETQFSNVCLVSDCEASGCFEGYTCCDLTSLGLGASLCVPEGECPV